LVYRNRINVEPIDATGKVAMMKFVDRTVERKLRPKLDTA